MPDGATGIGRFMHWAEQTAKHAVLVGAQLRIGRGFYHRGKVHIPLGDGWTLALSGDSVDRVRLDACRRGRIRDTRWVIGGDERRLALVAEELAGHSDHFAIVER